MGNSLRYYRTNIVRVWVSNFLAKLSMLTCITGRDQAYELHPADYIIGPASGDPNLCLSWPRALPPSADGIDWQLG